MKCHAILTCSIVAVLAGAGTVQGDEQSQLKAGFAEADITPKVGMEAPGGYGKSHYQSIHDPCKVRAAVFDDGRKRIAVVGVDAIALHRPMVQAARQAIGRQCDIPAEAILICASHSHSSGPVYGIVPGEYDAASPLVRKLAYEHSTCVNPEYYSLVERQIVTAVCQADAARAVLRCGAGKGSESQVAFNRRFRMKNGATFTHPGAMNPDIVEPAGPTDPEVGVLGAWDEKGQLRGCLVNFTCHATCNPAAFGVSANYIDYLERAVRGMFGPQVVVVFLNGMSGDVTQVNNLSLSAHPNPFTNPTGEAATRFVGGRVGTEAVKALLSIQPGELAPVDVQNTVLQIKRRRPSAERVRASLKIVQKKPEEVGETVWTFAKEIVLLDAKLTKEPVAEVEVQALQIGPVVLLAEPGEIFCQFGLDLKAKSNFPLVFPVSLANGCVGYVPTEDAFGPHGGGYETRLTSYSNLEITAGRQMTDAVLELSRQMKPGTVPLPVKGVPGLPWPYGNVPPELE